MSLCHHLQSIDCKLLHANDPRPSGHLIEELTGEAEERSSGYQIPAILLILSYLPGGSLLGGEPCRLTCPLCRRRSRNWAEAPYTLPPGLLGLRFGLGHPDSKKKTKKKETGTNLSCGGGWAGGFVGAAGKENGSAGGRTPAEKESTSTGGGGGGGSNSVF